MPGRNRCGRRRGLGAFDRCERDAGAPGELLDPGPERCGAQPNGDRVGCQRDLVSDGETGWVFPAGSHHGLRNALARALTDTARDSEYFRKRVLERIASYTYATASSGLAQALRHASGTTARIL